MHGIPHETPGDATANAWIPLSASQARVLGCLIEKEATTPDTYPLTANAAQAAANQKTARDPVMALDPGEVQHALRRLEERGLAKQTYSSRAERYAHRAGEALSLTRQQTALLGVLLLRGPQTAHELLARSERMAPFEGVEDVRHHLERLMHRDPALVQLLSRGGGQREDRYMHLLCGAVDVTRYAADIRGQSSSAHEASPSLAQRVQSLEEEVAALREEVAALTRARQIMSG